MSTARRSLLAEGGELGARALGLAKSLAPARARRLVGEGHKGRGPFSLAAIATLLGAVAGLGAYVFRMLIALCHNVFFLQKLSFDYVTTAHTPPSPWGPWVVLAPVAGAVLVVFLTKNFAPEAKGHGVPEVMDAIYYQKSRIRPIVALIKSLASALSIGSGGSVGREGPIIQIGAAFASWVGRVSKVSRWEAATLVAAGGGAGIAATFNTPIGGVLFAVEVLMHEVSVRTLVPVALATATATYVGQFFFGSHPAFEVPAVHMSYTTAAVLLPAYLALGVIMAGASVLFIKMLYGAEDFFDKRIPRHPYLRHMLGMLCLGVTMVLLMHFGGHYYIEGVGYATIMDVLRGALTNVWLLLLLFALKLVATSLTLGSGASGGIFSPSLLMGAALGGGCGIVLQALFPGLHIDPVALALAGMAGLVAGATGAALTAIVMIFEMTLDYSVVLPMTLTVAVSYGLRRLWLPESIYTMKLARRGHYMPHALQANAHLVHHVSDLAMDQALVLPHDARTSRGTEGDACHVVCMDRGRVSGVLAREWMLAHPDTVGEAERIGDVAHGDFVTVAPGTTLFDLIARMQSGKARVAVVVAPEGRDGRPEVLGVVTKAHVAEAIAEGMEMFED